ncbi:MAG: hypothetical protein ACR2FO_01080 [Actinomycetota bacterium]
METATEPLWDETIVVRFGLMDVASIQAAAALFKAERGVFGLSAYGDNGLAMKETARQARRPHKQLRTTTVGRLKSAGFVVKRTGKWPHLTISAEVTAGAEMLSKITELFDDPVPNPHPVDRNLIT